MDIYEVQKNIFTVCIFFQPCLWFLSVQDYNSECLLYGGRDDPLTLGIRCTRRVTDWERHLSKALKNRPAPASMPTSLPSGSFLRSRNNTCRGSAGAPPALIDGSTISPFLRPGCFLCRVVPGPQPAGRQTRVRGEGSLTVLTGVKEFPQPYLSSTAKGRQLRTMPALHFVA